MATPTCPVAINFADKKELAQLPNVDPNIAQAIVNFRNTVGNVTPENIRDIPWLRVTRHLMACIVFMENVDHDIVNNGNLWNCGTNRRRRTMYNPSLPNADGSCPPPYWSGNISPQVHSTEVYSEDSESSDELEDQYVPPIGRHQQYLTRVGVMAIVAICAGVVLSLAAVTAVAYKCYRRRVMQNAQNRLSSAIKKGLKESSSGKKPSSRGSTVMKVTKATSPISPPEHPAGPGEKLSPGSFSVRPDTMDSPHHVGKQEVHFENEKGGETPEKDEERKIKETKEVKEMEIDKSPKYLGALNFSVEFDSEKSALLVNIMSLTDLPPRDPSVGGCDPYVKLQLLPEKRHKCKTRVLRKTLNPVYDETFTFYGIALNQVPGITLHFVILSFDRYSRDAIIGEVLHQLQPEQVLQEKMILCRDISPRHLKFRTAGCGELLVSLCYQPAANRLTVVVLKARNLPKMDLSGLSDPYVKIYLLYNGQRIAKKKTHVKKRTLNPVFNESFLFDVPYNEGLQNISLEFLVLDWDRVTKNEVVGRLEIGSRSRGAEHHHWNEVMNCPRKQIAEWHKLSEQ